MKKAYIQLHDLNSDLITGYKIRSNNHMELLDCLKIVNQAIQKAANLRGTCTATWHLSILLPYGGVPPVDAVGKPKTLVVAGCREALKTTNVEQLIKVMKMGATS